MGVGKVTGEWVPYWPVPVDAPPPPAAHPTLGPPAHVYTYRTAATGAIGGYVWRIETADGKEIRPLNFCEHSETGARAWRWKGFAPPRPLYGLDRLVARLDAPVVVAEGEKAADAAARLLPDHVAVASSGGSNGAGKTAWAPLDGRRVTLWPDADEAGAKFADKVARILGQRVASLRVVAPPADAARGWDAADAEDEGWSEAEAAKIITAARLPDTAPSLPRRGDWKDHLIRSDNGNAKAILANAACALRAAPEWAGVLAFNEFTGEAEARKPPPWADPSTWAPRVWRDHDDLVATQWLQHEGVCVGVELIAQAVQAVAGERVFHPVRDYLAALTWDGKPRLDNWVVEYLGVETGPYARAVGRRFVISGVARAMRPGVKADHMLVLEGPQGTLKSSALKALCEPWFTDEIADFGSKDAAEQLQGVWLVEIAELGSLTRVEVGRIKAFTSRSVDRFRPSYGRRVVAHPRQCVFAGTVNTSDYLRDETGGRRFWPLACGTIDVAGLANARDQLWAEAVAVFAAGERWWLETPELQALAAEEQDARYQGDPWEAPVREYVQKSDGGWRRDSVSVRDVLEGALGVKVEMQRQADQNRVVRCLTAMGWRRRQVRDGPRRERRYFPPEARAPGTHASEAAREGVTPVTEV